MWVALLNYYHINKLYRMQEFSSAYFKNFKKPELSAPGPFLTVMFLKLTQLVNAIYSLI
jgi:hypothetical protein